MVGLEGLEVEAAPIMKYNVPLFDEFFFQTIHPLPSKISPFRSKTITKIVTKVTVLGHICQFFITKRHNSLVLKVKK